MRNAAPIQDRLDRLSTLTLFAGSHVPNDEMQACTMELVAWVAGEPWSDSPECACPVIGAFLRSWNDALPSNADRDRLLRPLIPLLIGTRSTPEVEQRRATLAADWLIRVHTPTWLRAAKLLEQAQALESLPEITDFAQCPSLMPTLNAVRSDAAAAVAAARDAAGAAARAAARGAAWDAAVAAAWDAAWEAAVAAAWDEAGAAAWAAAWDAAWEAATAAAWDAATAAARAAATAAAWDVAWYAAWDAAWDAAGAAAWGALKPITERLQASAVDLVKRMVEA